MSATTITLKPIRQLPLQLANQIAAGEVVERPASVVKELLENSLDAGASRIDISIRHGGVREITVRDNGSGIPADELALALSRHATSKIDTQHDLVNIRSLGFRGEALASIASVSRLQLSSCIDDAEQAWGLTCENGQPQQVHELAHPRGSTVQVLDLFYNTPARRKFLRNERTEFRHIDTVVRRVALSHFATGIKLQHNGRTIYQLNPANTEVERQRRVVKLCGKTFMDHAVQLDFEARGIRLSGWLTRTGFSRSSNELQHFFVNGRMIRDRLINHAIHQVYQECLLPGRFPGFVLQLEIDPEQVDVNVHPTKHEVRFREARLVHDFIYRSCHDALHTAGVDQPNTGQQLAGYSSGNRTPAANTLAEPRMDWPRLMQTATAEAKPVANETHAAERPFGQALGLLHNRFLLAQVETGMVMIDLHRAQSSLRYQQLLEAFGAGKIIARPLLVPVTLRVAEQQANAVELNAAVIKRLGLDLDRTGPESVMVRMLPGLLRTLDIETAIPELLLLLADLQGEEPSAKQWQELFGFLAGEAGDDYTNWTHDQLNSLLRRLEVLDDPTLFCSLSLQQIQALINPVQN